jgi:peroxiredoxin
MKWLDRFFGGPKDMAALPAGTKAPDFSSPAVFSGKDGGKFSLQSALKQGPVLAAFFKVSCPVCQYTFPYLERMHKAHGDNRITIVGISQDNQRDTAAFLKEYGVTFPTLLDDPNGYAVSNAYGLTNVPSLFLIGQAGSGGDQQQARRGAKESAPFDLSTRRRRPRLPRWLRVEKLIPRSRDKAQGRIRKAAKVTPESYSSTMLGWVHPLSCFRLQFGGIPNSSSFEAPA